MHNCESKNEMSLPNTIYSIKYTYGGVVLGLLGV